MPMPPRGHPDHPEMQGIYGQRGSSSGASFFQDPHPDGVAVTQAAVDELLGLLRDLVNASDPPDFASHSALVGARLFSKVPPCPEGHPECHVWHVGNGIGTGARRNRYVGWKFPGWDILAHTRFEDDGDTSMAARGMRETEKTFHMDTDGTIYDPSIRRIGSVDALDAVHIPWIREDGPASRSGLPLELVRKEIARWRSVNAKAAGPVTQTAPSDYVRATVVPWLLSEMAKRNNPELQNGPKLGLRPVKAWRLIQPVGWLFLDGQIMTLTDLKPRLAVDEDLPNLQSFGALRGLSELPPPH